MALLVGVLAWLLLRDDDSGSGAGGSEPTAASVEELRSAAASVDHPVYWVGARQAETYELTRTAAGRFYIRYLPQGIDVGDRRPNFLTIGTYPQRNAYAAVRTASRRKGAKAFKTADGGLVVVSSRRPSSVYVAYPGQDYQVEVYDPDPSRARAFARSDQLRPIR